MSAARITPLCEDSQTDAFVRRFLKHRNLGRRDIYTPPLPDGRQAGDRWVRERYPQRLKAMRRRGGACLIVVTDADTLSASKRRDQLQAECKRQGIPPPGSDDPVLLFVPRRNIETWFAYLDGKDVNERDSYPKLPREGDCSRHASELARMCTKEQRLREPAPPSLREACEEYPRLTAILR